MKYVEYVLLGLFIAVIIVSGCENSIQTDNPPFNASCTADAKLCSDGTSVGRNVTNNCEFNPCNNLISNEKIYVSNDTEQCKVIRYMCVQGKQPFSNENGCGCEPIPSNNLTTGTLKAYECIDPRPIACTKEYMPVCGKTNIQCITTPCNPIDETYANKCEACSNKLVDYYVEGVCQKTDSELEGQCLSVDGRWLLESRECEGISQDHCEFMGGQFDECASACRNYPPDVNRACTMQCVQTCRFKI